MPIFYVHCLKDKKKKKEIKNAKTKCVVMFNVSKCFYYILFYIHKDVFITSEVLVIQYFLKYIHNVCYFVFNRI